ncbi:hypothetical protein D3C81_2200070 [compost metagenome]
MTTAIQHLRAQLGRSLHQFFVGNSRVYGVTLVFQVDDRRVSDVRVRRDGNLEAFVNRSAN